MPQMLPNFAHFEIECAFVGGSKGSRGSKHPLRPRPAILSSACGVATINHHKPLTCSVQFCTLLCTFHSRSRPRPSP